MTKTFCVSFTFNSSRLTSQFWRSLEFFPVLKPLTQEKTKAICLKVVSPDTEDFIATVDSLFWLHKLQLITIKSLGDDLSEGSAGLPIVKEGVFLLLASLLFLDSSGRLATGELNALASRLQQEAFQLFKSQNNSALSNSGILRDFLVATKTLGLGNAFYTKPLSHTLLTPASKIDLSELINGGEQQRVQLNEAPTIGSKPSPGAVNIARVIVFQLKPTLLDQSKFNSVLERYRGGGIYFKQSKEVLSSAVTKAFKKSGKLGYFEFALEVESGVETRLIIEALLRAGAIKRSLVHHEEIGFHNRPPESTLRYSEWIHLTGTSYQSIGGLQTTKLPRPISRVNKIL